MAMSPGYMNCNTCKYHALSFNNHPCSVCGGIGYSEKTPFWEPRASEVKPAPEAKQKDPDYSFSLEIQNALFFKKEVWCSVLNGAWSRVEFHTLSIPLVLMAPSTRWSLTKPKVKYTKTVYRWVNFNEKDISEYIYDTEETAIARRTRQETRTIKVPVTYEVEA